MKNMSQIGSGKVFGYEAESIPSWEDALTELDKNARVHWNVLIIFTSRVENLSLVVEFENEKTITPDLSNSYLQT